MFKQAELPPFEEVNVPEEYRDEYNRLREALAKAPRFDEPSGRWFHASRHRLEIGEMLIPGGGETASDFYDGTEGWNNVSFGEERGTLVDMGAGRAEWVWLTISEEDAEFWAAMLGAHYIYEVDPVDNPVPWNGTGVDGWVCLRAKVTSITELGNE